jgi:hypothetical protein
VYSNQKGKYYTHTHTHTKKARFNRAFFYITQRDDQFRYGKFIDNNLIINKVLYL